ncbi:MAG: polysaccharide pyruvyl transferase family protein [Candidatus Cloacimonetes bacterium]|nr:polysaccharide pyruvyl transferase family protein [Candidatus Cloacimonadota bacterium]
MKIIKKLIKKKINYNPEVIISKGCSKNYIIHHYCPHTFNAGDHFVIRSIRKYLLKYLPEAVFVPKAIAGNRGWGEPIGLKKENIYISNKYADAVIMGGSDQYHDWSPKIEAAEINNLNPPLFLIGLGVSSKDLMTEPYLKKEQYKKDILATNQKCSLSSVRDKTTSDFLKNLGFDRAIITGCPALYLFDNKIHRNSDDCPVLLTFPYPLLHRQEENDSKFSILLKAIKILLNDLAREKKTPIIVCHDDRDVPIVQEIFPKHNIFFSNYVEDYFELYNNAQMVIGSRLHATILASGMGIPAININLDLRGTGFTETFGLTDWNINYNDPDLSAKIRERIKRIDDNDLSAFSDFARLRMEYKNIYETSMKNTAEIIRSSKKLK